MGALEITHVLHLHDAEQALSRLGKLEQPDLTSLRARANLALYVQERFTLSHLNGDAIILKIVGAEIDGSYAYVYQDASMFGAPDGLEVENTLLQDIYLNQTNLVNITLRNELKSLTFFTGDSAKKIEA